MNNTAGGRKGKKGAVNAAARRAVADTAARPAPFRSPRTNKSRNALVERYLPLVRGVASRLAVALPSSVDPDDLISAGTFGLMDAVRRFDPKLGTRFETYCAVRIRGAMLDELRHLNWVPRMQCSRVAKVGAATAELKSELGRPPTQDEIARKSGLRLSEIQKTPSTNRKHLSLMSTSAGAEEEGMRPLDVIEAEGLCDPAAVLQERERRDILAREVRKLPRPERLLVMLYYFEELTMKQIGEVLNVTESRVCQMHAEVLALLQQRLVKLDEAGAQA